MSNDPNNTGADRRRAAEQEHDVRRLKAVMREEFPDKNEPEIEEAIGQAMRQCHPPAPRDRIEELIRQQFA